MTGEPPGASAGQSSGPLHQADQHGERPLSPTPTASPRPVDASDRRDPAAMSDPVDPFTSFVLQEGAAPDLETEVDHESWSDAFPLPFQLSEPLPALASEQTAPAGAPGAGRAPSSSRPGSPSPGGTRWRMWLKPGLISVVVVLTVGFLGFTLLAPAASPHPPATHATTVAQQRSTPGGATPGTRRGSSPVATAPPSRLPPQALSPTATGASDPGNWIPVSLPTGWTSAGLTLGDALFAERTAVTFTDREMSLDYRSVGTRAQHGGTLTAAVFLLTPAARERFRQQDVRVTTNQLYDLVVGERLIQAVIDPQPRLMAFAVRGQQQFAWVEVTFTLWQSLTDPQTGQSQQGLMKDPTSQQPRVHRMGVLLVRVPPASQGANAPMGGTGWLVSNYGLDTPGKALPPLLQPA
ncbi:hypothetical protein [Thermogemmatispora onikobensis]|uniref:hypothetical protein n=1 Tax=Thermogemmatispora onikobensis TaxID=732234 RepID=UPI000A8E61A6|nr:hypothetical protein [Thermogemmatispora onikobensis]